MSLQFIIEKIKGFFTEPGLSGRLAVLAMVAAGVAQYFVTINTNVTIVLFAMAALFGAFGRALTNWADNHQVTLGSLLIIVAGFIGDVLAPQSGLMCRLLKNCLGIRFCNARARRGHFVDYLAATRDGGEWTRYHA